MTREPERFGLPLYKEEEYGYFTSQAREARKAVRTASAEPVNAA